MTFSFQLEFLTTV
uniref:Uncharacterized protein n=1 Tax=Anguilla anguilla TaxID=7936 RepID=A0A0E9XNP5_ANGAN